MTKQKPRLLRAQAISKWSGRAAARGPRRPEDAGSGFSLYSPRETRRRLLEEGASQLVER
jgi:hypothetical protein